MIRGHISKITEILAMISFKDNSDIGMISGHISKITEILGMIRGHISKITTNISVIFEM
jgi:hypothetical protein